MVTQCNWYLHMYGLNEWTKIWICVRNNKIVIMLASLICWVSQGSLMCFLKVFRLQVFQPKLCTVLISNHMLCNNPITCVEQEWVRISIYSGLSSIKSFLLYLINFIGRSILSHHSIYRIRSYFTFSFGFSSFSYRPAHSNRSRQARGCC